MTLGQPEKKPGALIFLNSDEKYDILYGRDFFFKNRATNFFQPNKGFLN